MIRIKNPTPARLPSEYQEVEYIESTGTQHIDTGICPTTDFYCKTNASFKTGTDYTLCGVYNQSDSDGLGFQFGVMPDGTLFIKSITTGKQVSITNDNDFHTFIIDNVNGKIELDEQSLVSSAKTCAKSFALFKRNSTYTGTDARQEFDCSGNIKLKSCEMINNGVHYNFVPCCRKSDNVPGLYDLVNNVFYTNAGSGTFLMGNEVGKRDLNINPKIEDTPLIRRYVQGKLVYGEEPAKEVAFTESIAPTDWTSETAFNELGEWVASSSGDDTIWTTTYYSYNAFDSSDSSYWKSAGLASDSEEGYIQLDCPVLIKPSGASVLSTHLSNGKIQGYNPSTESWETLNGGTFENTSSNLARDELILDTDTYYSKFRVSCERRSSTYNSPYIYDFKIIGGTYKI